MNQSPNSKTFYNPSINLEATAENIKKYIQASNLKISELQNLFGFGNPQAIYYWRDGKFLPSIDNLFRLAYFLHTSVEDLVVTDIFEKDANNDVPEEFRIAN